MKLPTLRAFTQRRAAPRPPTSGRGSARPSTPADAPDPLQPLGERTEAICRWFAERGWRFVDGDGPGCLQFQFTGSLGGHALNGARSGFLSDLKVHAMDCWIKRGDNGLVADIESCGVDGGCAEHRIQRVHGLDATAPEFPRELNRWEQHARNWATPASAYCLLFGTCDVSGAAPFPAADEAEPENSRGAA